jgi:nifR3 family TIM-barrel protein
MSLRPGTLFLAPMAGFSDLAFRSLCRRFGADVLVSEFVMANAVLEAGADSRVWDLFGFDEGQRPVGLQLFGADAARMAEAARRVYERYRPDFVDINCGCPAPKVVDQCAGSALLKDLPRATEIAAAVVRALPGVRVTVKMRTGWDAASIVAVEAARRFESVGVAALAVHGRTRMQGYSGDADWGVIGEVAAAVKIPVTGNGSVGGGYPVEVIRASGVKGVMVGRVALGNPWVFRELRAVLDGAALPERPTDAERLDVMRDYARALVGPDGSIRNIRAKLKPFTVDMPGGRRLRHEIDGIENLPELEERLMQMGL